jgi:hypothetical protein
LYLGNILSKFIDDFSNNRSLEGYIYIGKNEKDNNNNNNKTNINYQTQKNGF